MASSLKSILVVRTDRLGDVVLTLPMLPLLRRSFPDAHLSMLLSRYTGAVAEGNPYLDSIIWYDDGPQVRPRAELVQELRLRRFDAAIVARPTPRLAWLLFSAGIPLRIGTGYRFYSLLFTRRVYEHRRSGSRHELEYNLNLLSALGCSVPSGKVTPEFGLRVAESERREIEQLLGPPRGARRVILHPGSGGSSRDWPAERFGELGARLAGTDDVQIIVTGAASDRDAVERAKQLLGPVVIDLCGRLSVKQLAALISSSALFVSNSTGPVHIAAALGVPVLAFYPRIPVMSQRRWGPYTDNKSVLEPDGPEDCRKCRGRGRRPCECMASIPVELALESARRLLGATSMERGREVAHAH